MSVPASGNFSMFGNSDNTTIQGAITQGGGSVASADDFNELIAASTENDGTYKGFILEIESIPFTDTVNKNRAVGKNRSGIILISTESSFASNPQVLIDELKFIIDRDDLKSY